MLSIQSFILLATSWRTVLQDTYQIAQIIGIVLILLYVYYTYKTFKQIRKQTDYQQDAYLNIETEIVKDISGQDQRRETVGERQRIIRTRHAITRKYIKTDIPTQMAEVLKPIFNFDDNLYEGNYLTIILTNYGNAEVNLINVQLNLAIYNSEEVAEKKMLKDMDVHYLEYEIQEIIARNGGRLKIPLISTASFPIFEITITGQYFDVRNKEYAISATLLDGENKHFQILPTQS